MYRRWFVGVVVLIVCVSFSTGSVRAQVVPAGGEPAAAEAPAGEQADAPAAEGADEELTVGEAFLLKLRQGGLTMVFLFLASVAGVACAIERLFNLRVGKIVPEGLAERADRIWTSGRRDELEVLGEKERSTLARVLAVIGRHRDSTMMEVSAMAGDVAARDLRRHLQKAYPLAVVATVSPLLGLLGTVIGMIGAFDKVSAAGSLGDASMLGGDISKALITTGTGLTIAIPALVAYHFFKSRTNYYAIVLEETVDELISSWFGGSRHAVEEGADEG